MTKDKPQAEKPTAKKGEDEKAKAKKPDSPKAKIETDKGLDALLKASDDTLTNEDWLANKSNDELLDLLFRLALEIKVRSGKETAVVIPAVESLSFRDVPEAAVKDFTRLPVEGKKATAQVTEKTWRLMLISSKTDHEPLGVEISDDVVLGREKTGVKVDFDLSAYDADDLGVSRRHALLRPTPSRLLLMDLGSTNGTFCNAARIKLGRPEDVKDNDTISFGGLHFKLKVVGKPEDPAKK